MQKQSVQVSHVEDSIVIELDLRSARMLRGFLQLSIDGDENPMVRNHPIFDLLSKLRETEAKL